LDLNSKPMSLLNNSLKLGIASLKKPITKVHLVPDAELWPNSADVGFRHSDFTVIIPIDFALIIPGRYGAQNLDLLLGWEAGK
jgi:hypothetical protein